MARKDIRLPSTPRDCRTPRCGGKAKNAWSPYCGRCRARRVTLGHPEQKYIHPSTILPYERKIRLGLRQLRPELQRRVEERAARACAILSEYTAGVLAPDTGTTALTRNPMYQQACAFLHQALNSEHAKPADLILHTAARCLHRDAFPRAYQSDRAFQAQVIQAIGTKARVRSGALEWLPLRRVYVKRRKRMLPLRVMDHLISLWFAEQLTAVIAVYLQIATRHERIHRSEAEELRILRADIEAAPIYRTVTPKQRAWAKQHMLSIWNTPARRERQIAAIREGKKREMARKRAAKAESEAKC